MASASPLTVAEAWSLATGGEPFPNAAELSLTAVHNMAHALCWLREVKPTIVYRNNNVFFAFVMRSGHDVCGLTRSFGYIEESFQCGRKETDASVAEVLQLVPELPRLPRYVAPTDAIVPHPDECAAC